MSPKKSPRTKSYKQRKIKKGIHASSTQAGNKPSRINYSKKVHVKQSGSLKLELYSSQRKGLIDRLDSIKREFQEFSTVYATPTTIVQKVKQPNHSSSVLQPYNAFKNISQQNIPKEMIDNPENRYTLRKLHKKGKTLAYL